MTFGLEAVRDDLEEGFAAMTEHAYLTAVLIFPQVFNKDICQESLLISSISLLAFQFSNI